MINGASNLVAFVSYQIDFGENYMKDNTPSTFTLSLLTHRRSREKVKQE